MKAHAGGSAAVRSIARRRALEAVAFGCAAVAAIVSARWAKLGAAPPALAAIEARVEPASFEHRRPALDGQDVLHAPRAEAADLVAPENAVPIAVADAGVRYFNGRAIRPVRRHVMRVTAYSPDHRSCGKWADGFTASGRSVWTNAGELVAADPRVLPEGSLVSVPGYADERVVPVLDVGGAIKGSRLDVLYPTHRRALQWGVQDLSVTVWEYTDE